MKHVYLKLTLDKSLPSLLQETSKEEATTSMELTEIVDAMRDDSIKAIIIDLVKDLMTDETINDIDKAYLERKIQAIKSIPISEEYPIIALEEDTIDALRKYAGEICDCPNCTKEREAKAKGSYEEQNVILEQKELEMQILSVLSHTVNQLAEAANKVNDSAIRKEIDKKILEVLNKI